MELTPETFNDIKDWTYEGAIQMALKTITWGYRHQVARRCVFPLYHYTYGSSHHMNLIAEGTRARTHAVLYYNLSRRGS